MFCVFSYLNSQKGHINITLRAHVAGSMARLAGQATPKTQTHTHGKSRHLN